MIEASFGRMLAPTTAIGCAALWRHIEAHEASYDWCLFDDCADSVCSNGHQLLSHIAAVLEAKPVRDGGRIMLHPQAPEGRPWFWTITPREHPPSIHSRGYSETREQAIQDFKALWLN
jgi:hypothetical protein